MFKNLRRFVDKFDFHDYLASFKHLYFNPRYRNKSHNAENEHRRWGLQDLIL